MILSRFLYMLILLLFGIYPFASGGFQPVTFVILTCFLLIPITGKSFMLPKDALWIFFLVIIVFSSLIWGLYHQRTDFLVTAAQAIFGIVTLLVSYNFHSNKKYEYHIQLSLWIVIITNALIYLLGYGRYNFYPRYNGLLNDPNQFGYYLLILLGLSIYFLRHSKFRFIVYTVLAVLIISTMSRSTLLGLGAVIFYTRPLISLFLLAGLVPVGFVLVQDIFILSRILEADILFEFWQRGFYRLIDFPDFLFLGAGKGFDERFGYGNLEVHSTPVAVIFYFGVVSFALYMSGIIRLISKRNYYVTVFILIIFMYGLTTYNIRTPITWWAFGFVLQLMRMRKNEEISYDQCK